MDLEKIFKSLDLNRTNVINYTEFLAACLEAQGELEEYRIAEAFDLMDADDSGYISRDNLRQILGEHSNEKYIDALIAEADFDKNGKITYSEFLQIFSRQCKRDVELILNNNDNNNNKDSGSLSSSAGSSSVLSVESI